VPSPAKVSLESITLKTYNQFISRM